LKRKIMWENAQRFYGLPDPVPEGVAAR